MRNSRNFFVLTGFILQLLTLTAGATQILYKSIEDLGRESTSVVQGNVVGINSFWNETRTKIFTETVIAVEETYKGTEAGEVIILQLGGVVDNVRVTVHGALQWSLGEEVVVFLEPYREGKFLVSGFSQGKFQVERDKSTGQATISRPAIEDAQLFDTPDNNTGKAGIQKIPLDQFIRQALGRTSDSD